MNHKLQELINQNVIGFSDVLEAYAQMCINQVRDITQDMILDEGVAEIAKHSDISPIGLTAQAVDWALVCTPEMMFETVDKSFKKTDKESYLEFLIRATVEQRAKNTKAFQVKFS